MKSSILYLDCSSGISGDMTVGALLDLGADRQVLSDVLASLPLTGYTCEIRDVYKSGIRACDFHVILDEAHENHDHDMDYLYGSGSKAESHTQDGREQGHVQEHVHDPHDHTHEHHHHHDARNLHDIIDIIRAGTMTEAASSLAIRIFQILAEAEAQAHGKPIEEVHFHEVGAVDSIVDIVAAAVCFDNLHPDDVVFSALTEGCGQVRCQHGLMPVPVPAVTEIAAQQDLTLHLTQISGELVTPTGAAIAAAVRTQKTLPDDIRIQKVGLGAGKRKYEASGILRAMWCESAQEEADAAAPAGSDGSVLVLETNVDDCTGEALSYTMQKLLDAGALDAFCIPIYMKKNRPAYLLEVICDPKDRTALESILFQNTTTIGIRRQEMQRTKLDRRVVSMQTPWGTADIKCCAPEGQARYYPESDSVSRLAAENGIGFPEMYSLLQAYAREHAADG